MTLLDLDDQPDDQRISWANGGEGHDRQQRGLNPVKSVTPTQKVPLTDIGGSWVKGAIDKLVIMGVVMGYPDGTAQQSRHPGRVCHDVDVILGHPCPAVPPSSPRFFGRAAGAALPQNDRVPFTSPAARQPR